MKNKNIITRILTIFLLMIVFYSGKGIYAVKLKYLADVRVVGTEKAAIIRVHAKYRGNDNKNDSSWEYYSSSSTYRGSSTTYSSYGMNFYGRCFSTWYPNSTSESDEGYRCRYDKYEGYVNATAENPINDMPDYKIYPEPILGYKRVRNYLLPEEQVFSSQFTTGNPDIEYSFGDGNCYKWRGITKYMSSKGFSMQTTDFVITKSGVQKLIDEYKDGSAYFFDNDTLATVFNIATHTLYGGEKYMKTGYQAIRGIYGMNALNSGTAANNPAGTSILNYYDNYLYIPIAKFNSRTLTVKYRVKGADGTWSTVKTKEETLGSDAHTFTKESISLGDAASYTGYIGGKMSKGSTKQKAIDNLSTSTDSWGWNTTSKTIPASSNEEHYYIELYYDYDTITEEHLDTAGNVFNSNWSKTTHKKKTSESKSFSAKSTPYYDASDNKYTFSKVTVDGVEKTNPATVSASSGANSLVFGKNCTVKFYYKHEYPRYLTVNYMVRQNDKTFKVVDTVEKTFYSEAYTYTKESINLGDAASYTGYIGGKMSKGTTKQAATTNLSSTTDSWGWNTSSKTIPSQNKKEYYYMELYYDYDTISEYHLDGKGKTIYSGWNTTHKKKTSGSKELNAKPSPFYYNYKKYVFSKSNVNGTDKTNKKITIGASDGASKLIFGKAHTVKFYYEYEPPRQVFVRHFVYNESTNKYERSTILTNSNAAIKDYYDNEWKLGKNGYNQRHVKIDIVSDTKDENYVDTITAGFNEQYTIDYNDSIKLDKSRTIENEGIKYEYQGYKVQNDTVPNVLTTKAQARTLQTNKIATISAAKKQKTYVDFYYTQTVIPPPGDGDPDDPDGDPNNDPTIDFVPKNEDNVNIGPDTAGPAGSCRIVYVPSGEKLKSYITAVTYRPYSIVYNGNSINATTGVISYKLIKYDAYKYVDGLIKNNSSSNYGYINSTDKKGVFNTNSNTKVNPIANNIDNVVKASRDIVKNLNPNSNDLVVNDGRKTTEADYGNDNIHQVNYDKYNGIRKPSGTAYYNVVSLVENGNDVYKVKKAKTGVSTKNDAQVNVFTPATIADIKIESDKVVNHSNKDSFVIQKNSKFTVTPSAGTTGAYNGLGNTIKYIKYYWMVADFDIQLVNRQEVYNKDTNQITNISSGQIVRAGTLIKIPKNGSFSGIATNEDDAGDIINQFSNEIKVVAVTWNATDIQFEKEILKEVKMIELSTDHIDSDTISKVPSSCERASTNKQHSGVVSSLQVSNMYDDAHYFVEKSKTSVNIGRVYDFKVTDCLDVNFKNVFRKSDTGNVNDLRGIKYFSGIRRLLVYGGSGIQLGSNQENKNNIFEDRGSSDNTINSVPSKTVLPFGPYKHINTDYVQAPKLGYKISFDLKTSGVYVKNTGNNKPQRYIKITPSYYYISKDGKTFKENIELYYKNSSGKYVNFVGSGYTIYFKPNDGYRTVYNPEAPALKDMSTKLEALKIGETSFKLTDNMMSYSDNNFVQAWYGEFKLPNSTIAVEVGADGKKDINNPLNDGYIGVRFNIQCIDKEKASARESDATIVSYNQNDKSDASPTNTTQWDYEGYLGFARTNIGKNLEGELRLQLEKGLWSINSQQMYNKVKGTVVLYDIDNRAANDFD